MLTLELSKLRMEIIRVARIAYDRGLVSGAGGNISARVPGSNLVLIKASGVSFRDLKPDDIVVMDINGKVVYGMRRPSKEWRFHLGVYRVRRDVNAVLHTHSPYATAYAMCGEGFPTLTAQAESTLSKVPVIDYYPPGSVELAEKVVEAFKDSSVHVALLKRHGVVVAGRSLDEVLNLAELVEETAKIILLYQLLRFIGGNKPGRI